MLELELVDTHEFINLYECRGLLNCQRIPIEYSSGDYYQSTLIKIDSRTDEVHFYIFDLLDNEFRLIFTYGEHPSCYVEGCEILEEIK